MFAIDYLLEVGSLVVELLELVLTVVKLDLEVVIFAFLGVNLLLELFVLPLMHGLFRL